MDLEKKYSIKGVRLFVEHEFNNMVNEYGEGCEFNLFTADEYFKSDIYKEYCLENREEEANNLLKNCCGFYKNKKIVVFLKNELYTKNEIVSLLITSFHELCHYMQKNLDNYDDYIKFLYVGVEKLIRDYDYSYYYNNWEKFYTEVEADFFGTSMAVEVLKKYPHLYEDTKDLTDCCMKMSECRYNIYNFSTIFNRFDLIREYIDGDNFFMNSIYDKDLKFQSIEDIYSNFDKLDFLECGIDVLSSNSFLKTIDFNKLSDEQANIMFFVLNAAYNNYLDKVNFIENYVNIYNNDDSFDMDLNCMLHNIDVFENILDKLENRNSLVKKKVKDN